ncbi:hypothetical protein SNR37_002303 [Agarivorans aestuarii]|uniref:Sulfotransferase family protein n=1 Tax=Agarivorans aestuarii TaxID=1563703 RepID=A0ABU7G0E4_9ALTE|nr:hypothetical protein [Agarivorans aestuarii]MEE1672892.1 hypothetical protein [Agarivorans aestuarii]
MSKRLQFVHIGMPKCASTYLQNVWHLDQQYQLVNLNTLMEQARKLAPVQAPGDFQPVPIALPLSKPDFLIGSSEGFSWAYTNQPKLQESIWNLHKVSAQLLSQAALTDTILIMVRSPISYMRSLHEQTIKEGGYGSFATFFQEQRKLIEATVDLKSILFAYQEHFENVVVLNAEELRNSPTDFWKKYQQHLDVSPPLNGIEQVEKDSFSANSSLKSKLYPLALLNRHYNVLTKHLDELDSYRQRMEQEYTTLRSPYPNLSRWINRRLAEFSSEADLAALLEQLGLSGQGADDFQRISIDSEMQRFISDRFLEPLSQQGTVEEHSLASMHEELANR